MKTSVFVQEPSGIRDAHITVTVADATVALDRFEVELPNGGVVTTQALAIPARSTIDIQALPALSALDAGQNVALTIVAYPKAAAIGGDAHLVVEARGTIRSDGSSFVAKSDPIAISLRGTVSGAVEVSDAGNGMMQSRFSLVNYGERMNDVRVVARLPQGTSLVQSSDVQAGSVGVQGKTVVWLLPWVPEGTSSRTAGVSSTLVFNRGSFFPEEFVRMMGLVDVEWKTSNGDNRTIQFFPLLKS